MLKILVWMEQQSIVWIFVVSGIVTLVLNYYLFDEQGMYGIALAFVLSEAVQLIGLSIQFLLKFFKNNKKIQ
jgi:O-antigen/teichoic acid export membrane protein